MRIFSLITALLLLSFEAGAAKRYWVGTGSNLNWNTTANWSSTSGGASGSSVPGSNDTATFNSGGLGQCKLDINISIKRLVIDTVYSDTLKQNGKTITIGTGGASLKSGYFFCDNANVSTSGSFTIDGCTFKSTSATFTVTASFTLTSGTFTHNSGTVKFNSTSSTITGSCTFYNLTFDGPSNIAYTFTIAGGTTLTVDHTLTHSGAGSLTTNTGNITANGDIDLSGNTGSAGGGSATITISGSGRQTLTGASTVGRGKLPKLTINKGGDTLWLASNISAANHWTYTAGTLMPGTSLVYFIANLTITGSHTLYDVRFAAQSNTYTIAGGTTLTVNGTLLATGTQSATLNTGTINAKGDITFTANWSTQGSATIDINGTSSQILTGSGVANSGALCKVNINKSSGTLYLNDLITTYNDWTYTQGTIDDSTYSGSLYFAVPGGGSAPTITGDHSIRRVTFYANSGLLVNLATGTDFSVTELLKFTGSNSIQLWTGSLHAKGDIEILCASTGGGNNTNLIIDGTGDQDFIGTSYASVGMPVVTISKTSGTLYLFDSIYVANNWNYTGGTVNAGTSTVLFINNANLDAQGTSTNMAFHHVVVKSFTRTLTGKLTATGNLTILGSTGLTTGGNDIDLGGTWSNSGTYTGSTTKVTLNGSGNQWIYKSSGSQSFYDFVINKSGGKVYGLSPVNITNSAILTKGIYKTTSTNILSLADNVTLSGGSDSSYIHGPLKKTGNDIFTFAVGDTTLGSYGYHPLSITAPSSATDAYTVEYSATNPIAIYGGTKVDSLEEVSTAEYWVLTRNAGSSTVTPKLGWNTNNGINGSQADLTIARHNGSNWIDLGRTAMTLVGSTQGTLTATIGVSASSAALTFARKTANYTSLNRKLDGGYYRIVNNMLRFRYNEEYNDQDNLLNFKIYKVSDRSVVADDSDVQDVFKKVYYGDNNYGFDISFLNGGLASGDYLLEVTNEKSELNYLRFTK